MDRTPEDILDECIERLMGGEPVEAVLAAYPGHAAALMPALRSAARLLSAPAAQASNAARLGAMRRMLGQIEASAKPQITGGWLSAFKRRPVAFPVAALVGGIALFGTLGVGASAATGTAPEPVRELLRFFSNSQIPVNDDEDAGVTPHADPTEEAGTPDDAADNDNLDDGNDGPGGGDGDDSGPSDNNGQGNGDGIDDDNSGPGSGDDDGTPQPESSATPDASGYNSGPGGDDDDDRDNSGPGGGGETPQAEDTHVPSD